MAYTNPAKMVVELKNLVGKHLDRTEFQVKVL
jgi:hypothetical protein